MAVISCKICKFKIYSVGKSGKIQFVPTIYYIIGKVVCEKIGCIIYSIQYEIGNSGQLLNLLYFY